VAPFEALAEVRAFAVARVGERALVAYVDAGDARTRGTVRLATVRAGSEGLEREGTDPVLAPAGIAVAIAWDGTRGAVAYLVSRPHRGENPARRRRQRPEDAERALNDPLGPSALTAGDVMLQRIDARGAPVGRPVLVFEENSRAYAVAVAPEGEGWRVAWSGGVVVDDEVRGTVRTSYVDGAGVARAAASDTGFTGEVGDALRIVPGDPSASRPARLVWSGERCRTREDLPPYPAPSTPAENTRAERRGPPAPPPPQERSGPPIECEPARVHTVEVRADGSTSALAAGPSLAGSGFALVSRAEGARALLAAIAGTDGPQLTLSTLPGENSPRPWSQRVLSAPAISPAPEGGEDAEASAASQLTPSRVPPPVALSVEQSAAAPLALEAVTHGETLWFVALSSARTRVIYGLRRGEEPVSLVPIAPGGRVFDLALAGAAGAAPWIFARTGGPVSGPLVFVDGPSATRTPTPPTAPWSGDERLRVHLLRARAARAAYTEVESTWSAVSARADAASNPHLAGLTASVRRLRSRWESACGPLLERARWLSRQGVEGPVQELARAQCELPPEPGAPAATP
jgi:hypothetical protein